MFEFMKELTIVFFCSWKFALTFPVAVYVMKMSFAETLFYTNLGGLVGIIVFAYLSTQIIQLWNTIIRPRVFKNKPVKPIFTKRSRKFIKIKNSYGFAGIVILNPIVLSIPISTFLVIKYYGLKKRYLAWLVAGQFTWSFIYTLFYMFVRNDVFN